MYQTQKALTDRTQKAEKRIVMSVSHRRGEQDDIRRDKDRFKKLAQKVG